MKRLIVWFTVFAFVATQTTALADPHDEGVAAGQAANPVIKSGINTPNSSSVVPGYTTTPPQTGLYGTPNLAGQATMQLAACALMPNDPVCQAQRGAMTSANTPRPSIGSYDPSVAAAKDIAKNPGLALGDLSSYYSGCATSVATVPPGTQTKLCQRYSGVGNERVEHTLAKLFPHARVTRMDSDALKRKDDYRRILSDFRIGKIDILVGTQMIAKGLHFPNVTLVGIIYADLSLHMPDFRAGERTFQLLTQVSGRAGRGDVEGEVIVQAFTPFHPAIQYARRHDFAGFYEQEIEFREQLKYPPVGRIALLTLKGRNEDKVKFSADHLRRELEKELTGINDLILAGPAPAPLLRAETFYRYQIMLRTRQMSKLSQQLAKLTETMKLPEDISLTVDVDPVNLA